MLTDFYSDLAAVFQYKYMYYIRYITLQYHNQCIILDILHCNIIISVLQISGAGLHLPGWIHRICMWDRFRCLCSGSVSMLSWCSLSGFTPSCWSYWLWVSSKSGPLDCMVGLIFCSIMTWCLPQKILFLSQNIQNWIWALLYLWIYCV